MDDTVMTLAVAQALADWRERGSADYGELSALAVRAMQDFGRRYPSAGYGGHFAQWISEDAIRNAISIGGDSDTIGAICEAVAGAFYGVPDEIRAKAMTFLPRHLLGVLERAESVFG